MLSGMIGKKIGMTHLFAEGGQFVPVTVLEVGPCIVTQLRTEPSDGYEAVQVGYGETKQLNNPAKGHLRRAHAPNLRHLHEFKATEISDYQLGQTMDVRQFFVGERVHVTARSKGRGFQGVMKRHGFGGGPKTHGQKDRGRAPGSIGAGTYPGRVVKGKAMPGHMGNTQVTVSGLRVEQVDLERNLLVVQGAVPGSRHALLTVRHADVNAADTAYQALLASASAPAEPDVVEEPPTAEEVAQQPAAVAVAPVEAEEEPGEAAPEETSETPAAKTAEEEPEAELEQATEEEPSTATPVEEAPSAEASDEEPAAELEQATEEDGPSNEAAPEEGEAETEAKEGRSA